MTAAPPMRTSTTAAVMAQPAPASHQIRPTAMSAGDNAKSTIPGFCLITSSALFARIGSISLPGMPSECQLTTTKQARLLLLVFAQKLLGVVVSVGAGLSMVKMWWWDPFGVAVRAFSGDPALLEQFVIRCASQGQLVHVGAMSGRPLIDVVDFGPIPGHIAAGAGTATILGV